MRKMLAIAILSTSMAHESQASDFFSQPRDVCSSLRTEGMATKSWKPSRSFEGEWYCMTSLLPFGTAGSNGMKNNIAFYVNGTSANRADDIRIKININNSSQRNAAFSRLTSATKALFSSIGEPFPPTLKKAINRQEPVKFSTEFGRVELILEPGRMDSFKVVLTDANFIAANEVKLNSAAGDFELCRQAVSRKVGYSTAKILGKGNPIKETGYKNYMLKGINKDLFFCEVHKGGRYKIKAAMGGEFPFKYIDEGAFE